MSTRTTVRSTIAGSNRHAPTTIGTPGVGRPRSRVEHRPESSIRRDAARSVARLADTARTIDRDDPPAQPTLDAGFVALRGTLTHGRRLVQ